MPQDPRKRQKAIMKKRSKHDNPKAILKQLRETAGEDNYHYLVAAPEMF